MYRRLLMISTLLTSIAAAPAFATGGVDNHNNDYSDHSTNAYGGGGGTGVGLGVGVGVGVGQGGNAGAVSGSSAMGGSGYGGDASAAGGNASASGGNSGNSGSNSSKTTNKSGDVLVISPVQPPAMRPAGDMTVCRSGSIFLAAYGYCVPHELLTQRYEVETYVEACRSGPAAVRYLASINKTARDMGGDCYGVR